MPLYLRLYHRRQSLFPLPLVFYFYLYFYFTAGFLFLSLSLSFFWQSLRVYTFLSSAPHRPIPISYSATVWPTWAILLGASANRSAKISYPTFPHDSFPQLPYAIPICSSLFTLTDLPLIIIPNLVPILVGRILTRFPPICLTPSLHHYLLSSFPHVNSVLHCRHSRDNHTRTTSSLSFKST